MPKIFASILLVLIVCFGALAGGFAPEIETRASATKQYGLTVDKNGTVLLDGKPFYGFGTNLFDLFNMSLSNPLEANFEEKLALVKKYDIPYVRVAFSGYDYKSYTLYDKEPQSYFYLMDQVVDAAEKYQIGIIASLMWWDPALPQYAKGKRSDMGKNDSAVMAFAKRYVSDVVNRYKNRPGIWGWEIGNEYNLTADLCDKNFKNYLWAHSGENGNQVNGYDYYTSTECANFYKEIARTIRNIDPYRLISSGNGDMRGAAYHMHLASKPEKIANANPPHTWNIDWTTDTTEQFHYMNAFFTPDPMDTISFHLQHGQENYNNLTVRRWGKTVTEGEYFKEYVNAAKKAKKALFLGEMGDFIDYESRPETPQKFDQIMAWVDEAGIQMAATWQFYFEDGHQVVNDRGIDGHKLKTLQTYNLKYRKEGKQDLSKAWVDVKKPVSSGGSSSGTSSRTGGSAGTSSAASRVGGGTSSAGVGSHTDFESEDPDGGSQAPVTEAQKELSKYMVSRSRRLSLDADNNKIRIDKAMKYDLFIRSIALKTGYAMKVFDAAGAEISDSETLVDETRTVKVYDPAGNEIRSFDVVVEPAESTASEPVSQVGGSEPPKSRSGALWFGIGAGIAVAVGGGIAAFFLLRKKKTAQTNK